MTDIYQDDKIAATADGITVKGYYPWPKHIAYGDIRSLRRVELSALRGSGRIWGTANPGYWANYDTNRRSKQVALILDLGKRVQPFLTPDDPDALEAVIRARANLEPPADGSSRGPII